MAFQFARHARRFALPAMLGLSGTAAGCIADQGASQEGSEGASADAITEVDQSVVKRQSIGNCWIYATASWAESLHKSVAGEEVNLSESYWTYWHWFDQIANGSVGSTISTGGSFNTAAEIINRYGMMIEGDFIPSESSAEMSRHQATAEAAVNVSLASGALKAPAARKDRTIVRTELNRIWGLTASTVADMDRVFGANTSRTLDRAAVTTGTTVKAAKSLPISIFNARTNANVTATLQDAIGTRNGFGRAGALAWNEVSYPTSDLDRRHFQERFQKALQHKVPVVLSWYVDFNAMAPGGKFFAPPATPGRQGGHMVVMEDYQATNVPGFGTLPVGVLETRPAALAALLDDKTKIEFIRIKNSWGSVRPDRNFTDGYHDLYMTYMNGPVQQCEVDANENPKPGTCFGTTPFESVVLPPGL